jgi:hypothetical protein
LPDKPDVRGLHLGLSVQIRFDKDFERIANLFGVGKHSHAGLEV